MTTLERETLAKRVRALAEFRRSLIGDSSTAGRASASELDRVAEIAETGWDYMGYACTLDAYFSALDTLIQYRRLIPDAVRRADAALEMERLLADRDMIVKTNHHWIDVWFPNSLRVFAIEPRGDGWVATRAPGAREIAATTTVAEAVASALDELDANETPWAKTVTERSTLVLKGRPE